MMRYIEAQIDQVGTRLLGEVSFGELPVDAGALARSVLPHDDSSLQWSAVGGGLCDDPRQKLEELFARYVVRYDDKEVTRSRTDDEVWSRFKRALDEKHITARLQPKKIAVADDEVEFARAYKNEQWHCIEPVSLDLALADSIKDKAHRWLGQITSVKDANHADRVDRVDPRLRSRVEQKACRGFDYGCAEADRKGSKRESRQVCCKLDRAGGPGQGGASHRNCRGHRDLSASERAA